MNLDLKHLQICSGQPLHFYATSQLYTGIFWDPLRLLKALSLFKYVWYFSGHMHSMQENCIFEKIHLNTCQHFLPSIMTIFFNMSTDLKAIVKESCLRFSVLQSKNFVRKNTAQHEKRAYRILPKTNIQRTPNSVKTGKLIISHISVFRPMLMLLVSKYIIFIFSL